MSYCCRARFSNVPMYLILDMFLMEVWATAASTPDCKQHVRGNPMGRHNKATTRFHTNSDRLLCCAVRVLCSNCNVRLCNHLFKQSCYRGYSA